MKEIFSLNLNVNWSKKIIIVVVILILVFLFLAFVHPFLTINKPIKSKILVVEGWLPDSFLKSSISEFNRADYKMLITTGGPLRIDSSQSGNLTAAEQAANKIRNLGFDNKLLFAAPYFKKTNHRTVTSFLALRAWLSNSNLNVSAINVFTAGVHGRKSYVICKKVMGESIKVGVISSPPVRYNPKFWWLSKRGIRLVTKNTIGYFYALFLTSP